MSVAGAQGQRSSERTSPNSRTATMPAGRPSSPPLGNADFPWDLFDSDAYLRHNYSSLHELDRSIIAHMAPFFASKAPTRNWRGIDVGSGTNLYPALAMLPLTDKVTLVEHSTANVRWLEHGIRPYGQLWDPFWEALAESSPMYRRVKGPRKLLPTRVEIVKESIFELEEAAWDIGTMFFVAESITGKWAEFELATRSFLRALKPGAPFVAAFVRNSAGYLVGGRRFPAVAVSEHDLSRLLNDLAIDLQIHSIGSSARFREGYDGMILVTGARDRGARRRRHRSS